LFKLGAAFGVLVGPMGGLVKGTAKWDRALAAQRAKRAKAGKAKAVAAKAVADKAFWRRAQPLLDAKSAEVSAERSRASRHWRTKCQAETERDRARAELEKAHAQNNFLLNERAELRKKAKVSAEALAAVAERDELKSKLMDWERWWSWLSVKAAILANRFDVRLQDPIQTTTAM